VRGKDGFTETVTECESNCLDSKVMTVSASTSGVTYSSNSCLWRRDKGRENIGANLDENRAERGPKKPTHASCLSRAVRNQMLRLEDKTPGVVKFTLALNSAIE